ncbi:unnamed protein product, partial [Polarella glacialis]
ARPLPSAGGRLSKESGIPALQLSWQRLPADGGTATDAIHDMLAAARLARSSSATCSVEQPSEQSWRSASRNLSR